MDWNPILNWKLLKGSHKFPGPKGGTCINEAAVVAAAAASAAYAYAAKAAYAAAEAAYARRKIFTIAVAILDEAICLGKQSDPIETGVIVARMEAAKQWCQARTAIVTENV